MRGTVKLRAFFDNYLISRSQVFRAYLDLKGYKVVKKFTFHDWKEDKLPFRYNLTEYGVQKNMIISPRVEAWASNPEEYPLLDQHEYEKIQEEKKKIYEIAVNEYIEARVFNFNNMTERLSQLDTKDYLANEIELIENSLNHNLKREVLRGNKDLSIITPDIRKSILEEINKEKKEKPSWKFQSDIAGSSNGIIPFKGLFAAHVNFGYLKKLKEKLARNKIDELIETFAWEKFEPKEHSRRIVEVYLKGWEKNQGLSYPRKTTVDELKEDYPEIKEIYSSSGSVIGNWEKKWENFRDAQ